MPEIVQQQDHRREFIDTLVELAEEDDRVCLIVPDVGFNYVSTFSEKFPKRFFNTGVTEAFTTIMAAAMAIDGWRPFVYSMINFVLFRPGEMVRNAIVFHDAPVVLLGVEGGPAYKFLGVGHGLLHKKEDFNFCDNIGLAWSHPQTNEEVHGAVKYAYESGHPRYIRL